MSMIAMPDELHRHERLWYLVSKTFDESFSVAPSSLASVTLASTRKGEARMDPETREDGSEAYHRNGYYKL